MKKIKSCIAIVCLIAMFSALSFESQAQTVLICFDGKQGAVGTWMEGSCYEASPIDCTVCTVYED